MKVRTFCLLLLFIAFVTANVSNAQNFWQRTDQLGILQIVSNAAGDIFMGYQGPDYPNQGIGVFRSTNLGQSFAQINSGLSDLTITALWVSPSGTIFTGTHAGGVFKSTNSGNNWVHISDAVLSNNRINVFVAAGDTIFAADGFGCTGVYRSTNNGTTWTLNNSGLATCVNDLAIKTGYVFAGTGTSGVYRSTNRGISWTLSSNGLLNINVLSLAVNPSGHIFACTIGGIFRSINNGDSWTQVRTTRTNRLAVTNTGVIFATSFTGGIFRSTNNGDSWTPINSGITDTLSEYGALTLASNGYLYTASGPLLYRSASPVTSVSQGEKGLPSFFNLKQNYPNPFNPTTNFEYILNRKSKVKIEVFDEVGKLVTTLVDGVMEAGEYRMSWNGKSSSGSTVSSGTYFYRLSTDAVVQTKKMILVK